MQLEDIIKAAIEEAIRLEMGEDGDVSEDICPCCEELDHEELEPHVGVRYEFEDVLYFMKRDKYRAFRCSTFSPFEYIYLDDTTYDSPTLVKVSECDMRSVYIPTAEDMFDFGWFLVEELD